jgi:hypothetical protein
VYTGTGEVQREKYTLLWRMNPSKRAVLIPLDLKYFDEVVRKGN